MLTDVDKCNLISTNVNKRRLISTNEKKTLTNAKKF